MTACAISLLRVEFAALGRQRQPRSWYVYDLVSFFFRVRGNGAAVLSTKQMNIQEASKAFSKDFMKRNGIPTAQYENFTDLEAALAHVRAVKYPIVIKASGLAAGKGVVLPESLDEALESVREMMAGGKFGSAGSEIVIEERLTGPEVSCLAFSDGVTVVPMPGAQDHKRVGDGDIGLNTGGMGACELLESVCCSLSNFLS